jgi:hypothetical protein
LQWGERLGRVCVLCVDGLVCNADRRTALFVQMGAVLPKGGPAGLFIGFLAYGSIILAVNECFGVSFPVDIISAGLIGWNSSGNGLLPAHSVTLCAASGILGG